MGPKTTHADQNDVNHSNEMINGKGSTGLLSTFNRKRRHTFDVDLKVERVLSLPFANGRFFFKIRLLNGGNHVYTCHQRFEVHENKVEFNISDRFPVKMTSRLDTFILDHCLCRISIRKEGRGGRSYEKIGFYDLDLASVAGCADELKACLLNGYQQTNTRPANAYLEIRMKLTVIEGDNIFRRPDSGHPYIKVDQPTPNKKVHEPFTDECSLSINGSSSKATGTSAATATVAVAPVAGSAGAGAGDLYPPMATMTGYGHSRQASKSSMCSNYSTSSVNSANNSIGAEKSQPRQCSRECGHLHNCHSDSHFVVNQRQTSDEETHQQCQRRPLHKRRTPFIDQFGDIQRRLQSTRVDVTDIVNSVMNQNGPTVDNANGYLCLMYNDDGTARVGSSSSCQSLHSPSSLFVSN